MSMTSIGDMASSLMLRTRGTSLKQTMMRLTEELSSGQVSDIHARVGGDYSYLNDIEHGLKRLGSYAVTANEAAILASGMQTSLSRVHDSTDLLSQTLLVAGPSATGQLQSHGAGMASQELDTIVAAMNTSVGGRSLFAGTATDQAALAAPEVWLDDLRSALAGLATVDDVRNAAQAWFDDPAGFAASAYLGGDQDLAASAISETETVDLSLRADDPEIRAILKEVALAALADDPGLALDNSARLGLLQASGQGLVSANDTLTGVRADLGFAEARIEDTTARNASARTSMEYARDTLLQADPFETATRLDDVQFQLESLYSVTVRMSRLSLVSFLR